MNLSQAEAAKVQGKTAKTSIHTNNSPRTTKIRHFDKCFFVAVNICEMKCVFEFFSN